MRAKVYTRLLHLQGDDCLNEVPIWEKVTLTINEAATYSNIGTNKLREMTNDPHCPFVLWNGPRNRLIKRKEFEKYLSTNLSI